MTDFTFVGESSYVAPLGTADFNFQTEGTTAGVVAVHVVGALPSLTVVAVVGPATPLTVSGVLPPLTVGATVAGSIPFAVSGTFPTLQLIAQADYQSKTSRPTVNEVQTSYQKASHSDDDTPMAHQDASSAPSGWASFWDTVTNGHEGIEHRLPQVLNAFPSDHRSQFQEASKLGGRADFTHQQAMARGLGIWGHYEDATKARDEVSVPHQDGIRGRGGRNSTLWQEASSIVPKSYPTRYKVSTPAPISLLLWHQDARKPPAGLALWPLTPGAVEPPCYTPDPHLVFEEVWAAGLNLLFSCPAPSGGVVPEIPASVTIPIKKAYIIMNEVRLFKVAGNVELPVLSMTLDLDMDSWAWGFKASLPGESLSLVSSVANNAPVELEAHVNGEVFLVLAEKVERNRSFGKTSITVTGRGHSAYLADPYSPSMNFSEAGGATAQQIMLNALTYNNVSIGWAIDWGLVDWFVPGGVWAHQGTYMDAVRRIAASAGGYVLPHKNLKTLFIKPLYPQMPWNWGGVTPDIELPSSVVETESIRWIEAPAYNGVYVSGAAQGVLGHVKRIGTAGDYRAPMVTDELITHVDAGRQRGGVILAKTGRMAIVKLSLPILPGTGIIEPGKMIRYTDGASTTMGLTKSVSLNAGAQPTVRQVIEVETHV